MVVCGAAMQLSFAHRASLTEEFAASHDAAISRCLAVLLAGGRRTPRPLSLSERRAQLPLRIGGLGLSSARERPIGHPGPTWLAR